jgi:hypothetical protein
MAMSSRGPLLPMDGVLPMMGVLPRSCGEVHGMF